MTNGLNRNNKREYLSIVVHCSVSDRDKTTVDQIRSWHKGKGWSDIGYHKVITGDGVIRQGREDRLMGAGTQGWNEDSIHICVTGDGNKDELKGHPQRQGLKTALDILANRHNIPVSNIIGHKDVFDRLGQKQLKSCPGAKFYAELQAIKAELVAEGKVK